MSKITRMWDVKSFILLIMILVCTDSRELSDMTPLELLELLKDTIQIRDGDVQEEDVELYLFTRNVSHQLLNLHKENENFDLNKIFKVLIHGWIENHSVKWYEEMKNNFLELDDYNVIEVDWERVARSFYVSSARNTQLVGIILANFIMEHSIPIENLHLIGHSLGSHVASFAAKKIMERTGSRIRRITALDPAGPYFRLPKIHDNEKLAKDDAEIVDVIHTDGGVFGYDEPVGTFDIYVNHGRRPQPGCKEPEATFEFPKLLENALCSHARSHEYFIQSIKNVGIKCKKCLSYESLRMNECNTEEFYEIVNQNVTDSMEGICEVETSDKPPYFY